MTDLSKLQALTAVSSILLPILAAVQVFIKILERVEGSNVRAKQEAELGFAKTRVEIWEKRSQIEERILVGAELAAARLKTKEAIGAIWLEAESNLRIIALRQNPPHIEGYWWEKLFPLYTPRGKVKISGWLYRILHWLCFVMILAFGRLLIWFIHVVYLLSVSGQQVHSKHWLFLGGILLSEFSLFYLWAILNRKIIEEGLVSKPNDIRSI